MKRVLITGENSYIGTNFQKWLEQYPQEYEVETISVRGDEWKEKDFSDYSVVYHVAGIAHIKETKANEELYYQVNRDLAVEVAKKSKESGVEQFIFLSSMSVFGLDEGVITKDTRITPKNAYGKSKREAEMMISELECEKFKVVIVRPPMVYGKNCTGNYSKLSKICFVFPNISNQRSMIYIDNLSYFVKLCIENDARGVFLPQNSEYVNTSEMVVEIAKANNKKIFLINGLNGIVTQLGKISSIFSKVFGTLIYDKSISQHNMVSLVENKKTKEVSFLASIREAEK